MNLSKQRACSGKKPHRTRGAARWAARQLRAKGVRRVAPYRCPHCNAWHTGHQPYDPPEPTP